MFVAVDDDERDESFEQFLHRPATFDEIKSYLSDALMVDIDTEEYGNPVGFQSAEIVYETMVEMTPEEIAANYGTE